MEAKSVFRIIARKWMNGVSNPGCLAPEPRLGPCVSLEAQPCYMSSLCTRTSLTAWNDQRDFCLMWSIVLLCTIFIAFCLKKKKKTKIKKRKRKLQMDFGKPRVCGPISLYGYLISASDHKSKKEQSTPLGYDKCSTKIMARGGRLYWGCFWGQCLISVRFLKAWQCLKGWEAPNII